MLDSANNPKTVQVREIAPGRYIEIGLFTEADLFDEKKDALRESERRREAR